MLSVYMKPGTCWLDEYINGVQMDECVNGQMNEACPDVVIGHIIIPIILYRPSLF